MYPIHKVVELDLFAKIEEINNHDEFYEEYKHWRENPTNGHTVCEKNNDQNTYN